MKTSFFLAIALCMCMSTSAEAQLPGKLKKGAQNAAERAVVKKTEAKVTRETEKAMDGILDPNAPKEETAEEAETSTPQSEESKIAAAADAPKEAKLWSKYNFVPGNEIIFEDYLSREENGEFPSRWDLLQGNAENASLDGEPVIKFDHNYIIAPLMEKEKYLPEVFTIEFDAYFNDVYHTYQTYSVRFYPGIAGAADVRGGYLYPLNIRMNGAEIDKTEEAGNKSYKKYLPSNGEVPGWKHVAISYNKRALKVFLDEERILNIPNIDLDPSVFSIQAYTIGDMTRAIKNIRIAEGGKKLYDRIVADGKFITRGITFDVNKSTLKPESMGVINEIAALMKEHLDLKLSIEGHTDSDGEESSNLKLSEQRANAVREALTSQGVEGSRLQAKGLGETVPVSDNSNPEGKANNRRVEFLKI